MTLAARHIWKLSGCYQSFKQFLCSRVHFNPRFPKLPCSALRFPAAWRWLEDRRTDRRWNSFQKLRGRIMWTAPTLVPVLFPRIYLSENISKRQAWSLLAEDRSRRLRPFSRAFDGLEGLAGGNAAVADRVVVLDFLHVLQTKGYTFVTCLVVAIGVDLGAIP